VLARPAPGEAPGYVEAERPAADEKAVAAAVALLRSAERPLLLADDGVLHSGAWSELIELAGRLGAPVITTIQGKSCLPESHPWSLGDMNSAAGQAAYPLADVVFAVGCRFGQTDIRWPWFSEPARLVHLDADATEIGRLFPVEVGLIGDTRVVLNQMLGLLKSREAPGGPPLPQVPHPSGWASSMDELRRKHRERARLPLLETLRGVVPPGGVIGFDVCVAGYRSRWEWPIIGPRSYFYPGLYVGMGYGLPAALGARVATAQPTVAVCGDGGFQMTMAELGTAVQHRLPVVVVVVNDGGLTLIRHVQDREYGGRRFAVDLRNPDFAAVAAAYGIHSERVATPEAVGPAVARALAEEAPALIELLQEEA
jgi:acetolactate synthase-1/2/3 large subunit